MLLGLNLEVEEEEINIKMGDTTSAKHHTSQWKEVDKVGRIRTGLEWKEMPLNNKNESSKKTVMPKRGQE